MMTKEETWNRLVELGAVERKTLGKGWELRNMDLRGADLTRADLRGADLGWANLSEANLSEADLTGADLSRANLTRADLTRADLTGADLMEANLRGADLAEANLAGADLTEADFTRANLTGVRLERSKIDSVRFNLADLTDADITGATFWGASTVGWKIDGIKAHYVYFCRADDEDKERCRRDFGEGQFEESYRALPTVDLVFRNGLSPRQLFVLNAVIDEIQRQNPGLGIRMSEISQRGSQTRVSIATQKDEDLEKTGDLIERALREAFEKGIPLAVLTQKINDSLPSTYRADIRSVAAAQPLSLHVGKVEFSLSYTKRGA